MFNFLVKLKYFYILIEDFAVNVHFLESKTRKIIALACLASILDIVNSIQQIGTAALHTHYNINLFNQAWNHVLCSFKPYSWRFGHWQVWESLANVPGENKAKRLPSVNRTTKKIHHHQQSHFRFNLGKWFYISIWFT